MKKLLITLLKIVLSAAIIGYLIYDAVYGKERGKVFSDLWDQPKQWGSLAAAWAVCTFAVLLTFIRWWILVRAIDVPCRFRDALRISFWGYLLNLAPLGIVGGDLAKTVMLGREQPGCRAKAFASVLVDRVIGLYILFVVASTAIWLTGFWRLDLPRFGGIGICEATFIITAVGTLGLMIVLGPDPLQGRGIRAIGRIPRVGPKIESIIHAIRMYNRKPLTLVLCSLMTVGVHCSFSVGCFLIACGLPGNHLSLANHFVVYPLSSATAVIPLPIGPFETVLNILYTQVSASDAPIPSGQGLIVALAYRLITVLIAGLGVFYYFGNRREMAEVMEESEHVEIAGVEM